MTMNETTTEKKNNKKILAIIIAALAAVIAVGTVIATAVIPREPEVIFYLDADTKSWYYLGKEAIQITDQDDEFPAMAITRDGERLFYRKDGVVYWRAIDDEEAESTSVIENSYKFYLHESGKKGYSIVYNDAERYVDRIYSLEYWDEKSGTSVIGEDLAGSSTQYDPVNISKDFKKVIYAVSASEENPELCDIYLSKKGKAGELIAEDITAFEITEDFSVLYYLTESGDLFLKKGNREAVKLADEVLSIVKSYNEGVYYYTGDLEEAELAYHDGKKEYIVSGEKTRSWNVMSDAEERPVIAYMNGSDWYIAVGGKAQMLDHDGENIEFLRIADNGKKLCFIDNIGGERELYVAKITSKGLGEIEFYNSDIFYGMRAYPQFTEDGDIYYCTGDSALDADLYFNKKLVDEKVEPEYYLMYLEDKKELVYIAYDDKGDWTVRTSKNGKKPKTVFEDVSRFFVTSHGNIAAVVYEGTGEGRHKNLYINNTKKPIAENVENIASLSSWEDYSYMAF